MPATIEAPARINWYKVKINRSPAANFPAGASCYCRLNGCGNVIVFNGALSWFYLTPSECKQHLTNLGRMSDEESDAVENRYQWELHR